MKVIIFNIFIYVATILLIVVNGFIYKFRHNDLIILLFSLTALISCVSLLKKQKQILSTLIMCLINFIQSFTFIIYSFCFKLLIGPDLSVFIIKQNDIKYEFYFKIFNLLAFLKIITDKSLTLVGVNILHFLMFIYFGYLYININKFPAGASKNLR